MSIEQESNVVGLTPEELKNPGPRTVGISTVDGPSTDGKLCLCWIAFSRDYRGL